jgi:thiol-disulfide isomerase/thioredoxin
MVSVARTVFLSAALLGCALPSAGPQSSVPKRPAQLPFAIGDARAVVLYFIASDCPISNRLLPEMLRIEREFAARRVRFYFVYPNSTETPATIRAHHIAYGIEHNTLTDPHEALAKLTGANVTPEAAILIPQGKSLKSVYTGRIDDRYLSLGTERPAATHHDLEDAIAAVLSNHSVPPPGGPPVGCAFMTLPAK